MSNQATRPWAVLMRYLRSSGAWTRWRVHGTYTTQNRAAMGAAKEKARWDKVSVPSETRVIAPGESREIA